MISISVLDFNGASWDIFYSMVSWCPFDRYNYASKLLMINFAGRVDGIT